MLLCDKTSRMMKVGESRPHQLFFSNGAEDWKLFHRLKLHLTAHSACSEPASVDSCFKRKQRRLDPTAWGWQGDRRVKHTSPGLAESPSAGKHDADREKQP